jgi:hypothetical protein
MIWEEGGICRKAREDEKYAMGSRQLRKIT